MRRLIVIATTLAAIGLPGTAQAATVGPTPLPSATFNGPVHSVAYLGDVIYVAGDFTTATFGGARVARERLAAIDARNGALLSWDPKADGLVAAIAVDSSGVYIAGDFGYINGRRRDSLAKLTLDTGAVISGFKHNISGQLRALALGHGRVYVGGILSGVDGVVRSGAAAFDSVTGALDTTWAPVADNAVRAIVVSPDRVYLGGRFRSVNSQPYTQKVAAVTPDSGAVVPAFVSKIRAAVNDLTLSDGILYVAIDGVGGRATAADANTGAPVWTVTADGGVQAIAVFEGVVYIGGHFDNICKSSRVGAHGYCIDGAIPRVKLAALTMHGVLKSWLANGNGSVGVHTLVPDLTHQHLVAGGEFTTINGYSQRRIAIFGLS